MAAMVSAKRCGAGTARLDDLGGLVLNTACMVSHEEGTRRVGAAYLKYVADNEQAREGKVLRTDLHATSQTRAMEGHARSSLTLGDQADPVT